MPRRRPQRAADGPGALPADIAAGPSVDVWCPADLEVAPWLDDAAGRRLAREAAARKAWVAAGTAWAREHGVCNFRNLLPEDVRYWTSALGRVHARQAAPSPLWP